MEQLINLVFRHDLGQQGEPCRLLQVGTYRGVLALPQVEVAVLPYPHHVRLADVGDNLLRRELAAEDLPLQQSQQQDGHVAGQEMPLYGIVRAQEDGTGAQLRLPDPERPLYAAQAVVHPVDVLVLPPRLRGHQEVVAGEHQVPLESPPVPRHLYGDAAEDLAGPPGNGVHGDVLRALASQRLLYSRPAGPLLRLRVLSDDLGGLLLPQGRVEGRHPLLPLGEPHPLPASVAELVLVPAGDGLVPEGEVPAGVPHVRPAVPGEPPPDVVPGQRLGRLREDVSPVLSAAEDVFGTVEPLVGDLDYLSHPPLLPGHGDCRREEGLLAQVPREDLHPDRDQVGIEEEGHGHDGARAVLLRGPLTPEASLAVRLEIVVRAVEVGTSPVSPEAGADRRVEDVDHVLPVLPEVAQPGIELSEGELLRRVGEPAGEDVRERPELRAGVDDPGGGQGEEDVGEAVSLLAPVAEEVDLSPGPEERDEAREEEGAVVGDRLVADLRRRLRPPPGLPLPHLALEALLAFRGSLAGLPQAR